MIKISSASLISIVIVIIILAVFGIVVCFYTSSFTPTTPTTNTENYSRVFPTIITSFFSTNYKVVTPLKPLISPLKIFKQNEKQDSIFIYNPKYFSPVRDQGKCGACWAFVTASLISDNVTLKIIKFGKSLNVQQLISCYPDINPCDGAAPEDVLLWLAKTQFKVSIDAKYLQAPTQCVKTDTGISLEDKSVKSLCKYIERESISNPTTEELNLIKENIYNMKQQLLKDGPIFASISVYQDFYNFLGDKVYQKVSSQLIGGHAVEIIGYCDEGIDVREGFQSGYWVCKNSWGTSWAPEYDFPGHFAIRMGRNECGIEGRSGTADTNVEYLLEDKNIPGNLVYNSYIDLLKYIVNRNK
jgi:C1A family cysteine protease